MEHISSRQNPLVKRIRALARGVERSAEVVLDGPHLVDEACRSGVEIDVAAFASDVVDTSLGPLAAAAAAAGVRLVTLPPALLEAIAPSRHSSGVVAIARLRQWSFEDVLNDGPPLILLLDGVQDPGNVGAIIRVAEACGATGVLVGPGSADPRGWKALRGSMGSSFRVPVVAVTPIESALDRLRQHGVQLLATSPHGGTAPGRARLDQPVAIMLGAEGAGLSPALQAAADAHVTIEMRRPVESLNVAITAALILYEASRQRSHVAVR